MCVNIDQTRFDVKYCGLYLKGHVWLGLSFAVSKKKNIYIVFINIHALYVSAMYSVLNIHEQGLIL